MVLSAPSCGGSSYCNTDVNTGDNTLTFEVVSREQQLVKKRESCREMDINIVWLMRGSLFCNDLRTLRRSRELLLKVAFGIGGIRIGNIKAYWDVDRIFISSS